MKKLVTKKTIATAGSAGALALVNAAPVLAGAAAGDGDAALGKTGTPAILFVVVGVALLVATVALSLKKAQAR